MTPERSEYMPPSATSISGMAKQIVRLMILAQVLAFMLRPPFPSAARTA